jgi:uncharacterized membrane protein
MAAPQQQHAPRAVNEPSPGMAGVVHRNIEAMAKVRAEADRRRTFQDRLADAITRFAGTMWFVYLHAAVFGGWIVVNAWQVPGVPQFDADFVKLATFASVEAIFLSTFILISQNRMTALADRRAELDLQISLLTEHELTRLIELTDAIAAKLGVEAKPPDIEETKRDVQPEAVVREIENTERAVGANGAAAAAAGHDGPHARH